MILKDIEIDEFIQLAQAKKIICFGAGQGLKTFCNELVKYNVENDIAYIVDNDSNKWGTKISCINKAFEIISPEKMRGELLNKDYRLVITCFDIERILCQLNSYTELNDFNCYFYIGILNSCLYKKALNGKLPITYKFFAEPQIPKVIHYCWFGKNPLPERYKEWMKSWKKYCPDYEIMEWNESNYDFTKNKYMKQAYDAKKWGFVPDYARLDIIYEHGGIYLDTDVELIRSLDDLLYQEGFCGFQDDLRVGFGLGFGAIKSLNIIRELRDTYDYIPFIQKDGTLNLKASPDYQTEFLKGQGLRKNGAFQEIEQLKIYPPTFLCGIMGNGNKTIVTENTFSLHHFDGSWLTSEEKEKKEFIRNLYANSK